MLWWWCNNLILHWILQQSHPRPWVILRIKGKFWLCGIDQDKGWDNTLRSWQHGRHFADDTFKCIFLNENVIISIKISLKFVPKGPINNVPALVQILAWRRPGDKPLSEARMVSLLTHICLTRPQWDNLGCKGQVIWPGEYPGQRMFG